MGYAWGYFEHPAKLSTQPKVGRPYRDRRKMRRRKSGR